MDAVLLSEPRFAQWQNYLQTCPDASLAHELGWRNVVEKTYRHTSYFLMAMEGEEVVGLLPLFLICSKLFGRFLATAPYLSYGGLLAKDDMSAGMLIDMARQLAVEEKAKYIEIRGLRRVDQGLQLKEKYCAYCLTLNQDPEVVWASVEKRARTAVRKAMKCGVTVECGAHFLADFVEVVSRLMRDLGTPFHGEAFYRNILDEFANRAEIFMVRYRDGFIGGGLTVAVNETLAWLYGGCLKAYRDLAGMNLLTWEIIRYACQRGAAYLDFGRSQWDSGTALFKRQWRARPMPLFYEYHVAQGRQVADMDPNNPKFRLPIAIWQRLPVLVTQRLGPHIIKDIV